ncbi:hypothetical protein HPP92_005465 [Vanilla planifolia]|uniref:Copper chaperone n=1 Tax=Vanilla planifolia TaxID=51239 RepID=A0A835VB06_VANPL|nr:hypothetical protein HPP92_005465 [Vanilla planifolia]
MAETITLKVGMSCEGCVGAVKREQKVTVKGNVNPEAVLQTVSKTGKKTSFWPEAKEAGVAVTGAETK